MTGALIILAVTIATGVVLYLTHDKSETPDVTTDDQTAGTEEPTEEACCGRHAVCEKGILRPDELYYDDEELDRFIGHEPDGYSDAEIEEFREILYTLRQDETYQWGMALTQRNIPLPLELRDEWIMLCEKSPREEATSL